MRRGHILFSTEVALKLVFIGFTFAISITFCVAQEAKQESISELIAKLSSDKEEVWRNAVLPLARMEDKAVQPLAEAIRTNRIYDFKAKLVYENLTSDAAKKELMALLAEPDVKVCRIATEALRKHRDSSAAPALADALERLHNEDTQAGAPSYMERLQNRDTQLLIARTLWEIEAKEQAGRQILNIARKSKGQLKYELLSVMDDTDGRKLMAKEDRLQFLLDWKIPMRVGRPEALEIRLDSPKEYERLFLDGFPDDDKVFLEKHRSEVVDRMLDRLRDTGSAAAALLLGYFKSAKALVVLQKWFIESESFYGWESSFPDALAYNQFPEHHSYEEAIKHITGKPINKVIQLTEEQVATLVQRYRGGHIAGSEAALYVLFKLKPDVAREEVFRKFRKVSKAPRDKRFNERFGLSILIKNHFLPKGLLKTEVRKMLGEPDRIQNHSWSYDCGRGVVGGFYVFKITFDNNRIVKTDIVEFKDEIEEENQ